MQPDMQPDVIRIQLDYADGSRDVIVPGQREPLLLYSMERKQSSGTDGSGLYTHGAIALTLFGTVVRGKRVRDYLRERDLIALGTHWFKELRGETECKPAWSGWEV